MIGTTDLMNFLMKSTSTYTRTDKTTAMVRIKTSSFILFKKSGFKYGLIKAICPRLHGTDEENKYVNQHWDKCGQIWTKMGTDGTNMTRWVIWTIIDK